MAYRLEGGRILMGTGASSGGGRKRCARRKHVRVVQIQRAPTTRLGLDFLLVSAPAGVFSLAGTPRRAAEPVAFVDWFIVLPVVTPFSPIFMAHTRVF